jgi:deoxyribose-phosphate aldolase
MPAKVTMNAKGGYTVKTPNGVHAKNTTKQKAEAQKRLLNAIDHGFKPTGALHASRKG